MMGTEIFKMDASWAEKLTKRRVQFLLTPTVDVLTGTGTSSGAWCLGCAVFVFSHIVIQLARLRMRLSFSSISQPRMHQN